MDLDSLFSLFSSIQCLILADRFKDNMHGASIELNQEENEGEKKSKSDILRRNMLIINLWCIVCFLFHKSIVCKSILGIIKV